MLVTVTVALDMLVEATLVAGCEDTAATFVADCDDAAVSNCCGGGAKECLVCRLVAVYVRPATSPQIRTGVVGDVSVPIVRASRGARGGLVRRVL